PALALFATLIFAVPDGVGTVVEYVPVTQMGPLYSGPNFFVHELMPKYSGAADADPAASAVIANTATRHSPIVLMRRICSPSLVGAARCRHGLSSRGHRRRAYLQP